MRGPKIALFLVSILLVAVWVISAQEDDSSCPAVVQNAMAAVSDLCRETGRNQACYGNLTLVAEPQPGVDDLQFARPGDIENVARIASLTLSTMNPDVPEWGMALMRLQANLPDTLPGQNVTVLLFGDVVIQAAPCPPELEITVGAGNAVNVRSGPSTEASIIGVLAPGVSVRANGRDVAGEWLRIVMPEEENNGWIAAFLMRADADIATLDVVEVNDALYKPMQAFYFRSGVGDSACAEAPEGGILLQTPQGAGRIELVVNGVNINLGSVAYLQTEAEAFLTIYIVEGQAEITAYGVTRTVPAGARASVPLDEALVAAGPPDEPEPYPEEKVRALPVALLPEAVVVSPPLTEEELAEFLAELNTCRVVPVGAIDAYRGPGTDYPVLIPIAERGREPSSQAIGRDGLLWYQITSNAWVRADQVTATGDCASLPVIQELPPVPTPGPTAAPRSVLIRLNAPNACQITHIPVGTNVTFSFGSGYDTPAEAQAGHDAGGTSISVNGQALPVSIGSVESGGGLTPYWFETWATWTAPEPGTYLVVGITVGLQTVNCPVTVEE